MRTLIVEDEPEIAQDMAASLLAAGFTVEIATDGEDAWCRGDVEDYDAVVLDLGLPKLDGLTVLRRWRSEGRTMPVIVLTARSGWTERVEGINSGADDYLTKPFQMEELVARLKAILRRTHGHAGPQLRSGRLELDTSQMRVTIDGRAVALTPLEFRLVTYFLHNRDRVIPSGELLEHVYGGGDSREVNTVEALIVRLRRKIGADLIENRRGHGYCIRNSGT